MSNCVSRKCYELPCRMRRTERLHTAKRRWKICDNGIEVDMSVSPTEHLLQQLPEPFLIYRFGAARTA